MRSKDLYLRVATKCDKQDIDLVAICLIMTERRFRSRSFRIAEYFLLIASIAFGRPRLRTTIGMGQLRYELWLQRYETHIKSLYASLKPTENYRMCKFFIDETGRNSIADILRSYNGTSSSIYRREFDRHFTQLFEFHQRFLGFPQRS